MKLSLNPQRINDHNWYYEARGGIAVIHEVRDLMTYALIRTDTIIIPWKKLKRSLSRYKQPDTVKAHRSTRSALAFAKAMERK